MAEFLDLIYSRKSVRDYANKPVPRDMIASCIEAASVAPSACNVQPWKFIVVDDPSLKEELVDVAFSKVTKFNAFTQKAPVIIVVVATPDLLTNTLFSGMQKLPYYLLDIGAACEQLLLRACELGLGTCWIGWFKEKAIKRLLRIPKRLKIVSLISLGYPKSNVSELIKKSRKELSDIIQFNAE